MNIKHLRTFAATVEHGGLRRACARLNLSEPAASRQIDALETELGLALFENVGRRLRLTAEGELLLQRSRQLLSEADMLAEYARALRKGDTGIVRLAATPQMITGLLVPFLARYRLRHPEVNVLLVEGSAARQRNRLEQGEVQLAIMPAGPGFSRRLLGPTHLLAVMLKSRPLSRGKVLEIRELADQPLLVMQREYASRPSFDAACEIAQVRPPILMECTTPQTLIELAAVDYGIAIVPSPSAIRDTRLRALPIVHRGISFGHWTTICWNSRRYLPPYAEELVDALVSHAQRAYPGRVHVKHAPPLPKPVLPN